LKFSDFLVELLKIFRSHLQVDVVITPTYHLPANSFVSRILFMSFIEMTISSKTGLLPPTSPVLPLCGQTANRFSLQYFNTADTSSVDFGFNTSRLEPAIIVNYVIWEMQEFRTLKNINDVLVLFELCTYGRTLRLFYKLFFTNNSGKDILDTC